MVQSVASVAKTPLLTLYSVDGAPPRAKSKSGPITRLVSTHPRKRGVGIFLIMGFSLRDPQSIRPSTRRTSFVVETSTYFSLPPEDVLLAQTLNDCPCDFPGSRRK